MYTTTWMNLKIVMPSERGQSKKRICDVWFHLYKILKMQASQSIMTEGRAVVARGQEWREEWITEGTANFYRYIYFVQITHSMFLPTLWVSRLFLKMYFLFHISFLYYSYKRKLLGCLSFVHGSWVIFVIHHKLVFHSSWESFIFFLHSADCMLIHSYLFFFFLNNPAIQ